MVRYGQSIYTKESQGTAFFVVVALLSIFWSTCKLPYTYVDICPRRRLHRMCALKKKAKTPCRMRGIPSNIHQVIKPMDYNN